MTLLDTSVLVESLGAGGSMRAALREAIAGNERIAIPSIVLYEWLRGPRDPREVEAQEALFPSSGAIAFGPEEVRIAADLYRRVPRARGWETQLAIAASAIAWNASLWTLNKEDFADVPGLVIRD